MSGSGKQCDYSYESGDHSMRYKCDRDAAVDSEYCIFHSEDKDPGEFERELKKMTEDGKGQFVGFVFPDEVQHNIFGNVLVEEGDEGQFKFVHDIVFVGATFAKGLFLSYTVFEGMVNFSGCTFMGECSFEGSTFKKKLVLDNMKCYGTLSFAGAIFDDDGIQYSASPPVRSREDQGEVIFTKVTFTKPETIQFRFVDLSRWAFLYTDVSDVGFYSCGWMAVPKPKLSGRLFTERILYDEISQGWRYRPAMWFFWRGKTHGQDAPGCDYDGVSLLYRELRINFERRLLHHEAGDFHIGEMEARRLALWHNDPFSRGSRIFAYFVMCAYKLISGYGERYLRAVLTLLVITFLFAVAYLFTGIQTTGINSHILVEPITKTDARYVLWDVPGTEAMGMLWANLQWAMAYSFEVITLLIRDKHFVYKSDSIWGWFLSAIESVLGVITIPLFVLALRRSFKRWKADS
ncbi:MAG: hypothetical protein A4E62_00831 [Syntrophorhabdus sp. PtaU1.Bin002]|nr:MAG: hypothetical protein A4E62_00831 [Syntrophorhabdus sp. PtaU1.Bin002]